MTLKKENRPLAALAAFATMAALVSTAMHIVGLPGCDGYALAADLTKVEDRLDKLVDTVNTLSNTSAKIDERTDTLVKVVTRIDERTRVCE